MSLSSFIKSSVAAVLAVGCLAVHAESAWPDRPIRMILPYAPGGYTDLTGRITAKFLEKELGQPVIVDTKAGAGGIVGSDFVAKAPADGYTLCMCSGGAISIAPVAQSVAYDPLHDFTPIGVVSSIPLVAIVNPAVPIKSIPELIAYAKANPGKLNYGSSGAGGLMNYAVQLFEMRTGTRMTHVPYKGGAPATLAVTAGEVQLAFTNMTDALPQMEAGKVRALAVTSAARNPFVAKLPTVTESGVPKYVVETWNGVMGPKGLPAPVVARLSAALKKMMSDPTTREAFAKIGATPEFTTPEAFKASIAAEVSQWTSLVKEIAEPGKKQ